MSLSVTRLSLGGLAALVSVSSLVLASACEDKPKLEQLPSAATGASAPKAAARAGASGTPGRASGTAAPREIRADDMKLPATFPKLPVPDKNPQSDAKVELGNELFFDTRLSVDGSRSCYSCHQNENGNGGKEPLAIGAKNQPLTRHSPVMWNVGFLAKLYWDGRADSLEAQAKGAWGGANMGVGKDNLEKKAKEFAKVAGYQKKFEAVFPGKGVTPDTIAEALAAYQRTLVCDTTDYDRYARGERSALDAIEKRGLELFMGKAGCASCHNPPFFSSAYGTPTPTFFNVGIGTSGKQDEEVDMGRMAVTKSDADWAAFKTPSLRNVSRSAPYFHDGSVSSLEEAVRLMAQGGIKNKNLSSLLIDRGLSADEIKAIVAFLGTLDCKGELNPPGTAH